MIPSRFMTFQLISFALSFLPSSDQFLLSDIILMLLPAKKSPGQNAKRPVPLALGADADVAAAGVLTEMLARRIGCAAGAVFGPGGRVAGLDGDAPLFLSAAGRRRGPADEAAGACSVRAAARIPNGRGAASPLEQQQRGLDRICPAQLYRWRRRRRSANLRAVRIAG